ncbi:flagellar protein FlaG [Idiomarina abyssalis]|uniref:flagellar protein FlaG n=1 Tax=Idiomarina abyssalis TaxID=86102 RepID=UPI001C946B71|nr:flagellar protein FlaG [Idiomarina abyssalis]QZN91569.1 flagellar protein FlaG [Idiomarina abyssalis]
MAELKLESSQLAYNVSTDRTTPSPVVEKKEKVIDTVQQVKQEGQEKQTDAKASKKSVAEVVEEMNQSDAIRSTSLQFVIEERGEPPVVQVVDRDSGEMIRQIPSELVVKLSKALDEMADKNSERTGILLDQQI